MSDGKENQQSENIAEAFGGYMDTLEKHKGQKGNFSDKREAEKKLIASVRSFLENGGDVKEINDIFAGYLNEHPQQKELFSQYYQGRLVNKVNQDLKQKEEEKYKQLEGLFASAVKADIEYDSEQDIDEKREARDATKKAFEAGMKEYTKGMDSAEYEALEKRLLESTKDMEGEIPLEASQMLAAVKSVEKEEPVKEEEKVKEEPTPAKKESTKEEQKKEEPVKQEDGRSGTEEKTLDVSQMDGAEQTRTPKGPDTEEKGADISWEEAFKRAQTHADEIDKKAYPKPTRILPDTISNQGADLESGAKIRVNPENPNAVVLHTKREDTYLEDCMTLMKASAEKGYTSVNIREGNEAFKKAMYQAAMLNGLKVKGLENVDEETRQAWDAELAEMKKGKMPDSYKKAKEASPASKSEETRPTADRKAEHAAKVEAKGAHEFTPEEKEKMGAFMESVDRLIVERIEGGAKKFSHADFAQIKKEWEKTGVKGVTVADVMAFSAAKDKATEEGVPGFKTAKEAVLARVCAREINDVTRGHEHQAAKEFTPSQEQKEEMVALLKKMEKKFGKSYGAEKDSSAAEKYPEHVEYFALQMKKMAKDYDVTPEALAASMQRDVKMYDLMTSSSEKPEGKDVTKGAYLKEAMGKVFAKAPTVKEGALAEAKAAVGKKIERAQIERAFKRAERQEKSSQKQQLKTGKQESKKLDLNKLRGGQTR